jgi:hypothetical protein
MENRNGLIPAFAKTAAELTPATGWAERAAAEARIETTAPSGRVTLGADKAYDVAAHLANLRALGVTPHVAQNTTNRRSAIDRRTTRHPGYAISQCIRKRILQVAIDGRPGRDGDEEPFGWITEAGGLRPTKHRGRDRVGWMFTLRAAACNLIRLPRLLAATGGRIPPDSPQVSPPTTTEPRATPRPQSQFGYIGREFPQPANRLTLKPLTTAGLQR